MDTPFLAGQELLYWIKFRLSTENLTYFFFSAFFPLVSFRKDFSMELTKGLIWPIIKKPG